MDADDLPRADLVLALSPPCGEELIPFASLLESRGLRSMSSPPEKRGSLKISCQRTEGAFFHGQGSGNHTGLGESYRSAYVLCYLFVELTNSGAKRAHCESTWGLLISGFGITPQKMQTEC